MRYPDLDSGTRSLTLLEPLQGTADAEERGLSPAWIAIAICERIAAAALLAALLPMLAVAGAIVWLLSRRPPLVAHARVGKGGATIWVVKLRSMWRGRRRGAGWRTGFIERLKIEGVTEIKSPKDPRITSRFAAFCRKYSIDELPQLWHVVEGKLSLVGPRPMTADELAQHYGSDASKVLGVKPGLTGLWQIRGRSSLNYRQRRKLDLFLVRKTSVRLYLSILLATLPRVIAGKDAW